MSNIVFGEVVKAATLTVKPNDDEIRRIFGVAVTDKDRAYWVEALRILREKGLVA